MSRGKVLILAALDIGTTNVKGESRVYIDGQLAQKSTSPSLSLGFSDGLIRGEHFKEATLEVLRKILGTSDIQRYVTQGVRPRLAISQLGEAFFAVDAQGEVIDGVLHTSQSPLGQKLMSEPGGWDLEGVREVMARHSGMPATDEITSVIHRLRRRLRHLAADR
jgi:hypothetical protein